MLDRRRMITTAAALTVAGTAERAMATPLPRDAVLTEALERSGAPALAGAVIGREGLIWSGAAGVRAAGSDDAVTGDDLWHLGSNTKAMTAMLYGRLVEDGLARWGATLPGLFPDMEVDAAWAETTIEDLMTHRGGLLDTTVLDLPTRAAGFSDGRPVNEQRTDLARRALNRPPAGEPGVFAYGNLNYILVGAAIERLTGTTWEDAMRARLFQPLGITSGGFGPPSGDQPRGHMNLGGPVPVEPDQAGSDNPSMMGPGATIHMTLADYGRFLILFLTDGGGFVTPETLARLTTPPDGADYALGWAVSADSPLTGGPMLAHEGSNTLWHVTTIIAPARGLAAVAASNDHGRGGPATQGLAARLIRP
ncbi:MAG: serine hydrolase domain-containing protein [Brevundimonas sp.]|uniref:serine hydrolase domain-containing protein n=1 Tax=Brevundimonas sp. TaxID=1871086 RepID=UPI00391976AC